MEKNNEVIQTHPLVGWDISTVDSYDALMLRLHYQTPDKPFLFCRLYIPAHLFTLRLWR